jgi:hypothetical protein
LEGSGRSEFSFRLVLYSSNPLRLCYYSCIFYSVYKKCSNWASKKYEFPIVAQIARDHLAIPATSAASESVFSVGSDIITKKRNRLGTGNTRRLLCLWDWGVLKEGGDDSSDVEIDPEELDCWE